MNKKKENIQGGIDLKQEEHLNETEERRKQIYRNMSAEEKVKAAEQLFHSAAALKSAHFRRIHPTLTEEEIHKKVRDWMLYART